MSDCLSLPQIGRRFNARFYLGMIVISIVNVFVHYIFYVMTDTADGRNLIRSTITNIVLFVFIKLIGVYILNKPLVGFFKSTIPFDDVTPKIEEFPRRVSLWVLLLSIIYSIMAITFSTISHLQVRPGGILYHIPNITGIIIHYCIFPPFFTYFYVQSIMMTLKKELNLNCGFQFSSQPKSIWKRVVIILLILSLAPQIQLLSITLFAMDHTFSGATVAAFKALFLAQIIYVTIGIVGSSYFIARWFRAPVQNLLDLIHSVRSGDFEQRAPIISDDEVGVITDDFNSMVKGLREREFIRETFGKYISKNIADMIIDQQIELSGELRLATILTTDIEGYTGISEKLEPQEVVNMLSLYFTDIIDIINKYDGMVNKFVGDAVFALFNVPFDDSRHAKNAIRAALEIQKVTSAKEYHTGFLLKTRIGINTGLVIAGNIGSLDRFDYTVIGDEVNVASRLEALNKKFETSILIGQNTYELVKDTFNCTSIGEHKLKGRKGALEVYEIAPQDSGGLVESGSGARMFGTKEHI